MSLRVVLESVLRNVDGERVTEGDVRELAAWQPRGERTAEVPFTVSRVLLQDSLRVRIDTPVELELYRHGGILPYVFRRFLPGA